MTISCSEMFIVVLKSAASKYLPNILKHSEDSGQKSMQKILDAPYPGEGPSEAETM